MYVVILSGKFWSMNIKLISCIYDHDDGIYIYDQINLNKLQNITKYRICNEFKTLLKFIFKRSLLYTYTYILYVITTLKYTIL